MVTEALGTGAIPAELAAILAAHSQPVREDGTACTLEECSGQVIHSFQAQIASGVDPVPGMERVTAVILGPDRRVLLIHSLFSVWVNVYLAQRHLFACLGKLPVKGLPPGDEYLQQGLRVMAHRFHCAAS